MSDLQQELFDLKHKVEVMYFLLQEIAGQTREQLFVIEWLTRQLQAATALPTIDALIPLIPMGAIQREALRKQIAETPLVDVSEKSMIAFRREAGAAFEQEATKHYQAGLKAALDLAKEHRIDL